MMYTGTVHGHISSIGTDILPRCHNALARYFDGFVRADAQSNPFGYPPYGIYLDPPHPERQTFRDGRLASRALEAGRRGLRWMQNRCGLFAGEQLAERG